MVENVIPTGMYRTEDHAYDPVEVWNRMLDASEWQGECRVWVRATKNGYGILSVARGTDIAARYDIHPNTVYGIKKGRSWTTV